MAPGRSLKTLVSRRRRGGEEEEDDESVLADDTQSEASVESDLDNDADADASDLSDTDTTEPMIQDPEHDTRHPHDGRDTASRASNKSANGEKDDKSRSKRTRKPKKDKTQTLVETQADSSRTFAASADTDAMRNGLKQPESDEAPVDFEDTVTANEEATKLAEAPVVRRGETLVDRRKREHDEYKKKRDSDPTFIPNRGNFFMHDARTPEQRGFASSARGRGRGRGGFVGGPFSPAAQAAQAEKAAADAPWTHDLHDAVNDGAPQRFQRKQQPPPPPAAPTSRGPVPSVQRPLNFSKTTQIGNVQIRVSLPGMKAAIPFSQVPVKSHTRLPDHRPPLRRDKPVRISLPDAPPRYVFPSAERSFIFIPRALRPNQQGFGRARGSFGAYAGSASRRTSMYGGSVYSPSVVSMSRRSSMAREFNRDVFSPTGSFNGRPPPPPQAMRPVVRLPQQPGSHRSSNASPAGSVSAYGRPQPYPLPQKPAVEHWAEHAPMYQPRPQKTISVTGIESPAGMSLHAPQQQDQLPFHNQLPNHIEGSDGSQPAQMDPAQYQAQPFMYPGSVTTGTPLSNIPERAIHAQPFQPPVQTMYPPYPMTGYYYPTAPGYAVPGYAAASQPQPGYPMVDPSTGFATNAPQDTVPAQPIVAYESNGMVFYQDPSQVQQYPQQDAYLQPPSYAVPGMGGMMTPSPDAYYYSQVPTGPVYYPQA